MVFQNSIESSDDPIGFQVQGYRSGRGNRGTVIHVHQHKIARGLQFVLEGVQGLEFHFQLCHSLAMGIPAWRFASLGFSFSGYKMRRFGPDNLNGPFWPNALLFKIEI